VDHTVLHRRLAADLSTAMIYALLRLRVEVFMVEQACPYQELDGHDLDRTTRHYWLASYGAIENPQATLRLLEPTDGQFRIGRVCVARQARGHGGIRRLLEAALAEVGDAPCVLDAQKHCVELYGAYGFTVDGAEFTEAGVPHVPMRRAVPMRRYASARIRCP
jgi:ElaA protein